MLSGSYSYADGKASFKLQRNNQIVYIDYHLYTRRTKIISENFKVVN
jgi:hypothetical protein